MINQFAGEALAAATAPGSGDGNVCLSPLSAANALGLLAIGADTATRQAIRRDQTSVAEWERAFGALRRALAAHDTDAGVRQSSSAWIKQGLNVRDAYAQAARNGFDATISAVDFAAADTVALLNDWVRKATDGRITSLFEQLPADTDLILCDATTFDGQWRLPFDPAQTHKRPFRGLDGRETDCAMMAVTGSFAAARLGDLEIIRLDYGSGRYRAWFATALHRDRPQPVLAAAAAGQWPKIRAQVTPEQLDVTLMLPRLDLTWRSEVTALVQRTLFGPLLATTADYASLAGNAIRPAAILHATRLLVDEAGTKASAATAVITTRSANLPARQMTFDRPFLFDIEDRDTGTSILVGLVRRPGA